MITILLWRCPLCRTDDHMYTKKPFLRPQTVSCQACGARWLVRRVPGQDYRLRLAAGDAQLLGTEMALAEWYRRMKEGVALDPKPLSVAGLLAGEEVYAGDEHVILVLPDGVTLPPAGQDRNPPTTLNGPPRHIWAPVGAGNLYLTSRRLLWETPQGGYDFWWPQVRSAFSFLTQYFGIMYGDVTYRFQPPPQRLLKYLTYTGRMAERLAQETGQTISVGYH